ncbi:HORMA domain-containing protein [Aspergillus aurantiobrunneus]
MVRIKFTGPLTAVRSQCAQSRALPSSGTTPASSPSIEIETQTAMDGQSKSGAGENQVLRQQQSLEMVKIMLHVSFGTLFYLREFLPLQCFDDRDLREAQRQQKFSYCEFIDSNSNPNGTNGVADNAPGKGKRGQPLKIILRGSEPKADMIINVLETGIFHALSKSVLEALQLTIIADKEAPENVLESYTFSFKYTEGLGDLNKRLESLSIQPCGYIADMKSAHSARVGLETIVRRLITLSAFLPTLPNKRTLGVHLFYTEDCPPDYEPPGFSGARDGTINYPLTEHWQRETQVCGKMESGWHTVGLKVTSLKWTGPEPEASQPIPQIPAQIEYKDTVRRAEDIGFEDEENKLQTSQTEVGSSQEATQDIVERERLRLMMPSQEVPSSDGELVPTQPIKPTPALETENTEVASPGENFTLSSEKIAEMRKFAKSRGLDGRKSQRLQEPAVIRCQCDWDGEEDEMVVCSFCQTRQHRLCYGYVGAYKLAVPEVHACYRCLLEPNESQLLNGMNNIVLARRALKIILDEGAPSSTSVFADRIHCSAAVVSRLKEFLKRKGIMHPTPGYKPKECLRRGLPTFIVPDREDIHQRIQREIMDPMVKIKHHYTTQQVPDSLEALSPPATSEADSLSKPSTQNGVVPTGNRKSGGRGETNEYRDKSTDTPQQALGSMRRTRSSNAQSIIKDSGRRDTASSTRQSTSMETPMPTRKRTRSSQIGSEPQPVTPSQSTTTDHERESEGPRRSSRKKRRKISNYNKLIDVGAETSGNE